MRSLRLFGFFALLGLLGCGEGTATNCGCTIRIGTETLGLGCGEIGCLAGSRFGCDNDLVQSIGRCDGDLGVRSVDNGDGGQCLPPMSSCEGAVLACCGVAADAGLMQPSCDPVSRRCCVPVGGTCESSSDCCAGHACALIGAERRCAT